MNEIVLHQPPTRPWGCPNLSPFCMKLECYLRMVEIPYKLAGFGRGQAPKGKIPYIELDGSFMGDSQLIIEELERRRAAEHKTPLDAGLSERDAAIARLVRRTLEEGAYFITMYARWQIDEGYAATRKEFKKLVPGFVVGLIRRDIRKKLHHQGTGRHAQAEAMELGAKDFAAVAEVLGDRPFLLGDTPRTVDAAVFGFVEAMLGFPTDSPVKLAVQRHANLVAYRKRFRERWWKDLPPVQ